MKTNLASHIEKEINFFVKKFMSIEYKLEDGTYMVRNVDFIINNDSNNESWKKQFSLCLSPELITHNQESNENDKYEDYTTVWIRCEISIGKSMVYFDQVTGKPDFYKSKVINDIAAVIKSDLDKIGFQPFKDEDGFKNIFTRPKYFSNLESVEFSFFLNYYFPNGWWQNHVIEDL